MLAILFASSLAVVSAGGGGDPPPASRPLPHHPHDIISTVTLAPDYPDDPRIFVASPGTMNLFLVSEDHGLTWKPTRSGIRGQQFRKVALPSDWRRSGLTYVITEDGGLQISSNWGKTWGDPVNNSRLIKLALAPLGEDGKRLVFFASASTVFAGEGDCVDNRVILRAEGGHIESLAVSPDYQNDHTLFVGTSDSRLLVSKDGGTTWQVTRTSKPVHHVEPAPDFAKSRVLWIATWGNGVLRSDDGGATFGPCGAGLTDLEVNDVRFAGTNIESTPWPEPDRSCRELFACTRNHGVFYSMDGGATWTRTALQVQKTTQTTNHYTSLAVSPHWETDKTVLCGTFEGLNVSQDGGATWRESNVNPPRIGRIVDVSPTYPADHHVFACGYGMHLLVSEDEGERWNLRFTGMDAGSIYDISPAPDFDRSRLVLLGMYKGVRRSEDAGKTWERIQFDAYDGEPKDGYTTRQLTFAPGYPEDRRVFGVGTRGLFVRSEDLGKSWRNMGVVTTWANCVALSPEFSKDNTLYVAGTHLWVSEDAGATFMGPLLEGTLFDDGIVLPPDFSETGEMYAIAQYQGFLIGSKRGYVWAPSNEGLDGFIPAALEMSPNFAQDKTLYLLTSGGGMYRSTDRGRSWKRAGELGGPIDQGFTLAISPGFTSDHSMYVGTFDGFYRTRDEGRSWTATTSWELYDEKRDPWLRHGDWNLRWGGAPINNTVTFSKTRGDRMSIRFEGIACRLFGPKGPGYGVAKVWVDDREPVLVDQYSAQAQDQCTLLELSGLAAGSHQLFVEVTGERSAEAKGDDVAVDALEVTFR